MNELSRLGQPILRVVKLSNPLNCRLTGGVTETTIGQVFFRGLPLRTRDLTTWNTLFLCRTVTVTISVGLCNCRHYEAQPGTTPLAVRLPSTMLSLMIARGHLLASLACEMLRPAKKFLEIFFDLSFHLCEFTPVA
jgi:hypothetical protein